MTADSYSADRAVIEQELEEAVHLDFAEYVGFMAHYGVRLRKLAAKYPNPDGAFLVLRGYADQVVERLGNQ